MIFKKVEELKYIKYVLNTKVFSLSTDKHFPKAKLTFITQGNVTFPNICLIL